MTPVMLPIGFIYSGDLVGSARMDATLRRRAGKILRQTNQADCRLSG
jgi:hypothetical protein